MYTLCTKLIMEVYDARISGMYAVSGGTGRSCNPVQRTRLEKEEGGRRKRRTLNLMKAQYCMYEIYRRDDFFSIMGQVVIPAPLHGSVTLRCFAVSSTVEFAPRTTVCSVSILNRLRLSLKDEGPNVSTHYQHYAALFPTPCIPP